MGFLMGPFTGIHFHDEPRGKFAWLGWVLHAINYAGGQFNLSGFNSEGFMACGRAAISQTVGQVYSCWPRRKTMFVKSPSLALNSLSIFLGLVKERGHLNFSSKDIKEALMDQPLATRINCYIQQWREREPSSMIHTPGPSWVDPAVPGGPGAVGKCCPREYEKAIKGLSLFFAWLSLSSSLCLSPWQTKLIQHCVIVCKLDGNPS